MEILENEVIIQSTHWFKYIFFAIGLLSLTLGLFFFKKIPAKIRYILPTFGVMFVIAGLLSWFTEHNILLKITKNKISIEEQISGKNLKNILEIESFAHLEVMKAVSINQNTNGSQSESISFVLQMMRKNASPLHVFESQNLDKIYEVSQKIESLTKLKLYIIAGQEMESESFFAKFSNLKNVRFSKKYPVEGFKVNFKTSSKQELPQNVLLQKEDNTSFSWTNRKNIGTVLLFGGIIFLFFFLMHKVIIPNRGWKLPIIIAYVILCVLALAWLLTFTFSIFGKSNLTLEDNKISYKTLIFGQTLYEQHNDYKQVASIMNEINPNQSGSLQLFTHKGYKLFGNLATKKPENMISSMIDLTLNMKSYFMQIDVSVLTVAERLYLEQEIQKKILTTH